MNLTHVCSDTLRGIERLEEILVRGGDLAEGVVAAHDRERYEHLGHDIEDGVCANLSQVRIKLSSYCILPIVLGILVE